MSNIERRLDRAARRLDNLPASRSRQRPLEVPNPIEFATGERYLNQLLAPRQGTILKLVFLRDDLFTAYDLRVIEEWRSGFTMPDPDDEAVIDDVVRYHGEEGVVPDVFERIRRCRAEGRRWFREVVLVGGRRGGKGHLGAIIGAYVTYCLLAEGDPQAAYGIASTKQLRAQIFAGNRLQAQANQFADLQNVMLDAACFTDYVHPGSVSGTRLGLVTPAQIEAGDQREPRLLLQAKETTALGARGSAAYMLFFDEFAHSHGAGATSNSEQLWQAAIPALSECGKAAFVYQASSPWAQDGQFFLNYLRGLQVDEVTGDPSDHAVLVFQLPSWAPYEDAGLGAEIPMWPGGPCYASARPVIAYDDELRRSEQADPESFAVEYRARWQSSQDAYLRKDQIAAMFAPRDGITLTHESAGPLSIDYVAHADPSTSGANFAFVVAHRDDSGGLPIVVFDLIRVWRPGDFPNRQIDYVQVIQELCGYMDSFHLKQLTTDQFNAGPLKSLLRAHADRAGRPVRTIVDERTATEARNREVAESFKTALGHKLLWAPPHALARQEFEYVKFVNGKVRAPTEGPVRTKDTFDAMANVTFELQGSQQDILDRLGRFTMGGALAGGLPLAEPTRSDADELFDTWRRASARHHDPGERRGYQGDRSRGRR